MSDTVCFPRLLKRVLSVCLCLAMMPLSGCWDREELEDRALILGMAIDEADPDDGEKVAYIHTAHKQADHRVRVTVQIAIPGRVALGPSEGGGKSSGLPVWIVAVTGYSVNDALNNLQQRIADPRSLIHLRVIVVSEKIARRGLREINDYFRRNAEVRRSTWILVSEGNADKFMNVAPPLERVPTLYMLSMISKSVQMGKFPPEYAGNFWTAESKVGCSEFLPYVSIRQKENILLQGMALFSDGKMVGHTDPIEIGNYLAVKGMNPGGYSFLVDIPGGGRVMLKVTKRLSKMDVGIRGGKPYASIHVHLDTRIEELARERSGQNTELDLHGVETVAQQETSKAFQAFIAKTQGLKSDVFGFGEQIRVHEPGYWNEHIHSKKDWENRYGSMGIEVTCEVTVRRQGLKLN